MLFVELRRVPGEQSVIWPVKIQLNHPGGAMSGESRIQIARLESSIRKSTLKIWLWIKDKTVF